MSNALLEYSGVSRYLQVQEILKSKIVTGEYVPGDKIYTEKEYSKIFQVSSITVRQAILNLVAEGFLVRIPGKGTFVTEKISESKTLRFNGKIRDFIEDALKASEVAVLDMEEVKAPTKIAALLNLEEDGMIMKVRRTRINEGIPACYVINYLPLKVGRKISKNMLLKIPMLKILQDHLGIQITGGNQTIEAILADYDVASALSINMFSPVLYLETIIFENDKKPIESTQMFLRPDRYRFNVNLKVTKKKTIRSILL